jgi:hypothetical protein
VTVEAQLGAMADDLVAVPGVVGVVLGGADALVTAVERCVSVGST